MKIKKTISDLRSIHFYIHMPTSYLTGTRLKSQSLHANSIVNLMFKFIKDTVSVTEVTLH